MSDIVLLLGPIGFKDFEIPANIGFGGEQRLAVHKLLGGARVIDALGRDDTEITFNGIFSGSDATLRARGLDVLRAQGLPLPLTWDVFFYMVVIRSFEADYRSGWWIPYRIACTVVRDEAGALIDAGISLATSAVSDVASAVGQALTGGLDLSSTQALVAFRARRHRARPPSARRSRACDPRSPLSAAASARPRARSVPRLSSSLRHQRPEDGITALGSATQGCAAARRADHGTRLSRPGRGQSRERQQLGAPMNTVTVAGGNLFRVAAEQLGDATQWIRIAQLNGISDPMLSGVVVLADPGCRSGCRRRHCRSVASSPG